MVQPRRFPPERPPEPPRGALHGFFQDLKGTRRLAKKNHLSLLAASLAFFGVFTVCPFLILSFLATRYLFAGDSERSLREITGLLQSVMPAMEPWVSQNLVSVLRANLVSNLFGIALLCWSVHELFVCLHVVFEKISGSQRTRHVVWVNVISLIAFIIVAGSTAVVLFLFTSDAAFLKLLLGPEFQDVSPAAINAAVSCIAFTCVLGSISFLYKFMPTRTIRLKHALRGSVLFLVLFAAGRGGYALYVSYYRVMNENVYGGFFQVILVLTWIYYVANSFLLAAQYTIFLEDKHV